jgi:hypothetical protein
VDDYPLRQILESVDGMVTARGVFVHEYRAWFRPGNVDRTPRGSVCNAGGQAALDQMTRKFYEMRVRCRELNARLATLIYDAFSWCHRNGVNLSWADPILEEARRFAAEIERWHWAVVVGHSRDGGDGPLAPAAADNQITYPEPEALSRALDPARDRLRELSHSLAKLLAAAGGFDRLRFDADSYTISLDKRRFTEIDPDAFLILRAIWTRRPGSLNSLQIAEEIGQHVKNAESWSSYVTRTLDRLPKPLKKILRADKAGHWIVVPRKKVIDQ